LAKENQRRPTLTSKICRRGIDVAFEQKDLSSMRAGRLRECVLSLFFGNKSKSRRTEKEELTTHKSCFRAIFPKTGQKQKKAVRLLKRKN